jgi:hypothetical protein
MTAYGEHFAIAWGGNVSHCLLFSGYKLKKRRGIGTRKEWSDENLNALLKFQGVIGRNERKTKYTGE